MNILTQRIAEISAAATVFIVALLFCFLSSRGYGNGLKKANSGLDRSLGLLGGLVAGLLLVAFTYLAAHWELGEDNLPPYIAEARLRPYVQFGADTIRPFLPPEVQEKDKSVI